MKDYTDKLIESYSTLLTEAASTINNVDRLQEELDRLRKDDEAINQAEFDSIDENTQAQRCIISISYIKDLSTDDEYSCYNWDVIVYTFIQSSFDNGSYTSDIFEEACSYVDNFVAGYNTEVLSYEKFSSSDYDVINNIDDIDEYDSDEDDLDESCLNERISDNVLNAR